MVRYRPPPPPPRDVRLGGVMRYDRMPSPGPFGLKRYFWKQGVRIDAHLGTGMLEWWEALIVGIIVFPFTALFWYSAITYFPSQFEYVARRFAYYVFGDENVDILAATRGYIAEWLNLLWFYIRGNPIKEAHVEL